MFKINDSKSFTYYTPSEEHAKSVFLERVRHTFGCGLRTLRSKGGEVSLHRASYDGKEVRMDYIEIV